MGQNAVGSAVEVERNVPVQGLTSHNESPSAAKSAPMSAATKKLWQKLHKGAIDDLRKEHELKNSQNELSVDELKGVVLERATGYARELVSELGDSIGLDDLRRDIVANLQLLGEEFAVVSNKAKSADHLHQINALKIQAVLTSSVLDRYSPTGKDS